MHEQNLLAVRNLKVNFYLDEGVLQAVSGASFHIKKGETVGIIGESGCGKTVTALSILRLVPKPGRIIGGEIIFAHTNGNLLEKSDYEIRKIRGKYISMIFQEPTAFLNPLLTIGSQIVETIKLHEKCKEKEAIEKARNVLENVGLPDPSRTMKQYPYELSGGMNQRVMIGIAISSKPMLLIADEPTTALDVTTQIQIIDLLKALTKENNTSVILITHDFAIAAEMCEKVAVMYAGRVVESADTITLFKNPLHPYSKGLIDSIPKYKEAIDTFKTVPGDLANPLNPPSGCRFHPRCRFTQPDCKKQIPDPIEVESEHIVSCFLHS